MEIKVLGTGCGGCRALHETVLQVVAQMDIAATVVKEEDMARIMAYDVLAMPGLVIDEKLVSAGRRLTPDQVRDLITKAL